MTTVRHYTIRPGDHSELANDIRREFSKEFAEMWEKIAIPAMRRYTPRRTGRLRRAMGVHRDRRTGAVRAGFNSRDGFYWIYQKYPRGSGTPIRDAYVDTLLASGQKIAPIAARRAVHNVVGGGL